MTRKIWTAEEIEILRREYQRTPKGELAAKFSCSVRQLYQAAGRYGAAGRLTSRGEDFDDFLRRQHAQGFSDSEVAAAWTKAHPQRPFTRRAVCDRRNQLGLPSNAYNDRHRRRVAAKTKEQLAAAGVKSLAEVRAKSYAQFASDRGWPEDISPRQVQILDAIYEQGPRTRKQLAAVIGCAWKPQRNWLHATRTGGKRYQGGTYLTDLMHRGLVVRLPGRMVRTGQGRGNNVYLYAIPPHIQRNSA